MTVWPDGQGTWTTGPLELKKTAYNIFFELMVLLAIHGHFRSFRFHCLLSALLCGSNMCTQVSLPVSKLEIARLLQLLYIFKSSRAHLRHCVFCSSVSKWGSANLSQVQTLFQNCLLTAFWYASITSYISDRQSHILFNHNLYSSDVGLPGQVSSSTENFPALKALTHLKTVHIEMVWDPYVPHNSLNICFESILSLMRHLI